MEQLDFSEVEHIFVAHECWMTSKEIQWYESMWRVLEKQKLTFYETAEERRQVLLYAVTLMLIYNDFSVYAYDEPVNFYCLYYDEFEDEIPPFVLAQLYARRNEETIESEEDALLLLADSYRDKVISAIKAEIGLQMLFVSLYAVHYAFTRYVKYEDGEEDGDGEEYEDEDEYEEEFEPESAEEFWKLVNEEEDSIIGSAAYDDGGIQHAFAWIMDGAYSEQLYLN